MGSRRHAARERRGRHLGLVFQGNDMTPLIPPDPRAQSSDPVGRSRSRLAGAGEGEGEGKRELGCRPRCKPSRSSGRVVREQAVRGALLGLLGRARAGRAEALAAAFAAGPHYRLIQ